MQDFRNLLITSVLLIACGCLLGLAVNHQLVIDAFSGRLTSPGGVAAKPAATVILPVPILLEEVRTLAGQGAVLVDARPQDVYALGHLPMALSLPLDNLENALSGFRNQVPFSLTIITYCSGFGCQDSFDLAMHLILAGYRDVRVYEGGFPEWQAAGLPVAEDVQ